MDIQQEIERRELAFVTQLRAIGHPTLAATYEDIITLKRAQEVLTRSASSSVERVPRVPLPPTRQASLLDSGEEPFVLLAAVREMIKTEFGQRTFTTRQMFEKLTAKYPANVTEARRASLSATLANLVTKNELRKSINPQRKVTFQQAVASD